VTPRPRTTAVCLLLAVAFVGAGIARGADPLDPDQSAKVSADVNLSLRTIKSGVYMLVVQNQSRVGFIDSFAWVPGPGWRVTAVLATSIGKCFASDGAIACDGKLSPPKRCTCLPGGRMTITFRMTGPRTPPPSNQTGRFVVGTAGGYLVVKTVTLVHRHIPTALPTGS
jgi:hypothetical protein